VKKEQIGDCTLYLSMMEETICGIEHVDHILTDPPYLYIKTHDFDREWDEQLFFENVKRLLPDDGFIALFGRGTSFYRWNTRLADLGFVFKEEIVWNKHRTSGITKSVSRIHENISIHTKKKGKVKQCFIPYEEMRDGDYRKIRQDVQRILGALKKPEGLKKLEKYLETKHLVFENNRVRRYKITGNFGKKEDSYCRVMKYIEEGIVEKSIINLPRIIVEPKHPTEKPVRLAERILALISDPGDTIYDPFMGSGSFGAACINTGRKYIGSEMKPEYFEIACNRIEEAVKAKQSNLFEETA
jgi:site-specific DNA-methyltransferase (adenine-specific)